MNLGPAQQQRYGSNYKPPPDNNPPPDSNPQYGKPGQPNPSGPR